MLEGMETSGKVRLIQIAGETHSSHLSGYDRHNFANTSFYKTPKPEQYFWV